MPLKTSSEAEQRKGVAPGSPSGSGSGALGGPYVLRQATTPGVTEVGNWHVDGTGILQNLIADTSAAGALDAISATADTGVALRGASAGVGVYGSSSATFSGFFSSDDAANTLPTLVTQQTGASVANLFEAWLDDSTTIAQLTTAGFLGLGRLPVPPDAMLHLYSDQNSVGVAQVIVDNDSQTDDSIVARIALADSGASGAIATSSLNDGGADYVPGDTGTIDGAPNAGTEAFYLVDTVDGAGAVTGYTIGPPGYFYDPDTNVGTSPDTGIGTGFTIDILTIAPTKTNIITAATTVAGNYPDYIVYLRGDGNDNVGTEAMRLKGVTSDAYFANGVRAASRFSFPNGVHWTTGTGNPGFGAVDGSLYSRSDAGATALSTFWVRVNGAWVGIA